MVQASGAVRRYKPYFTPQEIEEAIQANSKGVSTHTVEILRQQACNFAQDVGERLGLPAFTAREGRLQRLKSCTTAFISIFLSKTLHIKQDVVIASILVASKLEDTLKKLREIQIASQAVKLLYEGVMPGEVDEQTLEYERAKLIGIERLILESVSFNFNLQATDSSTSETSTHGISGNGRIGSDVFAYIIKLGKRLNASKEFTQLAFRLGIDAHATLMPLSYPSHTLALACLWLASFLQSSGEEPAEGIPSFNNQWTSELSCEIEDVEQIAYAILNVMSQSATKGHNKSISTSPADRSPAEGGRFGSSGTAAEITQAALVRLQHAKDKRKSTTATSGPAKRARKDPKPNPSSQPSNTSTAERLLGRDDATIRFQF